MRSIKTQLGAGNHSDKDPRSKSSAARSEDGEQSYRNPTNRKRNWMRDMQRRQGDTDGKQKSCQEKKITFGARSHFAKYIRWNGTPTFPEINLLAFPGI
jgi:hypothetical protein